MRRRELLRGDGGSVPAEISNSRIAVGGRELLVAVVRDLRDRIETERQLHFQATVLDNVRDAVVALDRHDRVVLWNRGAESLFGWSAEEMLGERSEEAVTEGGLPALKGLVGQLSREAAASGDVPFRRKDGSRMWCSVTITRLRDEPGGG